MNSNSQATDRHSKANENEGNNKCRTFGDPIDKKEKECIRVMFQNVNGFGYTKKSVKSLGISRKMLLLPLYHTSVYP